MIVIFIALACNMTKREPVVVKSNDGKYQLTTPGDWIKETSLNSKADIQVSKRREELYVIVLSESKKDFGSKFTLEDFTKVVRTQMMGTVSDKEATEPVSVTVSGNSAKQYELSGTVSGIKAKYIHTTVETKDAFHQVLAWTLSSRFTQNKSKLLEVVNSFKEASGAPPQK